MTNFTIAAPLLALAAGALVILLLDLLLPAQTAHPFWYAAGLGSVLLSGYYLMPLWGKHLVGFNGAMVMDQFALVLAIVLLVTAFCTILLSFAKVEEDKSGYLALILWAAMGMILMASANTLMVIFLGIELLSLALYVAVAFDPRHPNSREAAFKYLILGSVAAAFILFGFALVYGATGTMELPKIMASAAAVSGDLYFKVGIGLSLVGFGFKMALVPFHSWAPDVYQGAPTPVTAFMSVGTKAAAFAAMARFLVNVVPADKQAAFLLPVSILAVASMILGATVGMWQNDLKRLMAYSGISHAGYLIMAIPGLGATGLSAATFYLMAYCFAAMGVFAVVTLLEAESGEGSSFKSLEGLWYRRPVLGAVLAFMMFALAGMPPAGTLIGKILLAKAAVAAGGWLLLTGLIVSTGISGYVYLRVIGTLIKKPAASEAAVGSHGKAVMAGGEPDLSLSPSVVHYGMYAVMLIAVLGTLWLGILPGTATSLLKAAVGM